MERRDDGWGERFENGEQRAKAVVLALGGAIGALASVAAVFLGILLSTGN